MFYSILEDFVMAKADMSVWDFLGINRCHWSRIKKTNKLTLEQYKKICFLIDYRICVNHKELAMRMVEVFPWKD
jgi:hypothetical protein